MTGAITPRSYGPPGDVTVEQFSDATNGHVLPASKPEQGRGGPLCQGLCPGLCPPPPRDLEAAAGRRAVPPALLPTAHLSTKRLLSTPRNTKN